MSADKPHWKYGPTAIEVSQLITAAQEALTVLGPRRVNSTWGEWEYDPSAEEWQWDPQARAYCALAAALGVL